METRINLEQDYKQQVIEIWTKYKDIPVILEEEYRKSPILPQFIEKNALLFVGVNPAFKIDAKIRPENLEIEFYPIAEYEKSNEKDIAYFEKFKDISNYCNQAKWTHIDLFFMRETNQKVIEGLSYTNVNFLQEQLEITFDIIEKATPRIIVVTNALASEFFGKKKLKHSALPTIWKGYDLDFQKDFDNEIGTYNIKIGQSYTPIIFSGMLSGQRALDIGSLERLKWQIKMILDKKEKQ